MIKSIVIEIIKFLRSFGIYVYKLGNFWERKRQSEGALANNILSHCKSN